MATQSVVPFDPSKLAVSLKKASREAAPSSSFLRMDKTGTWLYGADGIEIGDDAELMVNPGGFVHGYVCWGEAEKLGENMVPVTEPMPETGPVPGGGRGWEFQLGCSLVLDDMHLVYLSASVGGKRAIAGLAGEVADKLAAGDPKCVPVIRLANDNYKHKKYGKIYTPVLEVVKWVPVPAAKEDGAKPAAKPAAKKAAKK